MNLSGFEDAKNIADGIQEQTEGKEISNTLGTDNVNAPIDDDISAFNKGVEIMTNIGDYHVMTESYKSGSYHQELDPERGEHPMIDLAKGSKKMAEMIPPEPMKGDVEHLETSSEEKLANTKPMEMDEKKFKEVYSIEYVDYLKSANPAAYKEYLELKQKFGL